MGYAETLRIKKKGIRTTFCNTQVTKLNNLSSTTVEIDFYISSTFSDWLLHLPSKVHKKWNCLHKAMQIGNGKFQPSTNYGNGTRQAI